jgi:hypothetical protein
LSASNPVGTLFQLPLYAMRVGFEAQSFIALRLFRMATGGVAIEADVGRTEKETARAEAQRIVALSATTRQSDASPAPAVRLSRGRVDGNKKRPTRPVPKRA